ncbi:MAG: hypothetical protein LAT81_13375 [Oceanicaulis sp.]|nr:hypothetical protein [Oceanicaulis sp.]
MLSIAALAGAYLAVVGLVFLAAPLLPGQGALASARRRLELAGPFEKTASVISGALFVACGAGVLAWSAGQV